MNIWIVILIIFIIKVVGEVLAKIFKDKTSTNNQKSITVLFSITYLAFAIWILPVLFNSMFAHFKIPITLSWLEAMQLNIIIGLLTYKPNTKEE